MARPWLLFDLDVTLSKARFTGSDPLSRHIPGAVAKAASLGATATGERWLGAFNLRYFGPRPLTEENRVRAPSSTLAYARAGYRFNARTRLTVDVFNLFDRQASDIEYYCASRLPGDRQAASKTATCTRPYRVRCA